MAPVRQSGTRRTPPANQTMIAAGAEDFFVSPPWLQVSNSFPPAKKKSSMKFLQFLYPEEDLNPIFKHAELAAWGTGTSFPSKRLRLLLLPSVRPQSRTIWQKLYRVGIAWAII